MNESASTESEDILNRPAKRPDILSGHTCRVKTGCGSLYVTVNVTDSGRPFEVFISIGKAGGCAASQTEAIGKALSVAFRAGTPAEDMIKKFRGITCHNRLPEVSSCADAVAQGIVKCMEASGYATEGSVSSGIAVLLSVCPDCGGEVQHLENGRAVCSKCGKER